MKPLRKSTIKKFVYQFNKFFDMFSDHFTVYRHDVSQAAKSYISGLLRPMPRKNIERINEYVPENNYDAKHHSISDSPWEHTALNRHIAKHANALIGGKRSDLVIDESAFSKAGKVSVGVIRQYNGRLGKVDNCQVGVFAALVQGEYHTLIGNRLYLPKKWVRNAKWCKRAGIPKSERVYKSKSQLGLELVLEAQKEGVTFDLVTADAVYGSSEFSHALDNRGIAFSLDIRSNQRVYVNDPKPYVPEKQGNNGRPKHVLKTDSKATTVKTMIKRIKKQQWQRVCVWKGTKGYIRLDAFAQRVYFWNAAYPYPPSLWWLVITREVSSKKIGYFISNAPAHTTMHSLVARHRHRYWIERSFQESKSSIGMADYQIRKWNAWQHHMSLCMLALLFMLWLKKKHKECIPSLSCEDIILVMHYYLPQRIITEQNLIQILSIRHKKRHSAALSAMRCQKRIEKHTSKVPK